MILLSDGDPTYYNENYTTLSGKKYGNGSDTTENEAYYTIRTANYYKQQIKTGIYYSRYNQTIQRSFCITFTS